MRRSLKRIAATIGRFHRDEGGAEGLEKLLILAAIVLPLLGVLIWFRNDIKEWVSGLWQQQKGESQDWDNTGN
ncbi:MAG: hypothetical protein HQ546_06595 [Planctomycetes bacterium]|nr:hypothetical protein [Planctomycetota bacterium]